jgi:hypothetical protein
MTILCPACGSAYDPTLFQFGIPFRCDCGALVDDTHRISANLDIDEKGRMVLLVRTSAENAQQRMDAIRQAARRALLAEERKLRELQLAADRISFLITATDYPASDIAIETRKARKLCERLFPDRVYLFDMIYGARFRRLWAQFRRQSQKP